jgi:hypothetical protein
MSKIITTQIDGVSYQVLRRTFRPKKKEVTGWKKFHHDELLIYTLHLILKVIKLRRMRWAYQ